MLSGMSSGSTSAPVHSKAGTERIWDRSKTMSSCVDRVTVPSEVLMPRVNPPLYVPGGITTKKSVGVVSERATLPHASRTDEDPSSNIVRTGFSGLSIRTRAFPDTAVPGSLALKVMAWTEALPVRETFRTEQRFLNESVLSKPTASIGNAPSPKVPGL